MNLAFSRTWWIVCSLGILLPGCAPLLLTSGVVTGTHMVAERRGAGEFVEDHWVANKIRVSYLQNDEIKSGNINIIVYRGRVLLTGPASSPSEIAEAVRLAKATRGVTQVLNELKVQYESATELAQDAWLTSKIKAVLLSDQQVRGLDIHVETTKGVAYLLGTAASVKERDYAVHLVRYLDGVKEVVSYVEVDPNSYQVDDRKKDSAERPAPVRQPQPDQPPPGSKRLKRPASVQVEDVPPR